MTQTLRYEKLGTALISVEITDDYTVFAIGKWDKQLKKYLVTLELKEKTHGLKDMIVDETDDLLVSADMKTINGVMAQCITEKLDTGFFNYYIDRYNYMLRCFDRGSEIIEFETKNQVMSA